MLKLTASLLNSLDAPVSKTQNAMNFVIVPEKKKRAKKLPYVDMSDNSVTCMGHRLCAYAYYFDEPQSILTRIYKFYSKWSARKNLAFCEFFSYCVPGASNFRSFPSYVHSVHIHKNEKGYYFWEMEVQRLSRSVKSPVYQTLDDLKSDLHYSIPYMFSEYRKNYVEEAHRNIDQWVENEKEKQGWK